MSGLAAKSRVGVILLCALPGAAAWFAASAPVRAEDLRYPHLERLFQSRERAPDLIRPGRGAYAPSGAAPRILSRPRETPSRNDVRRPVRDWARHERGAGGVAAANPLAPVAAPKSFFVAVIGDAMSLMLADALTDSLARERPQVEVLRKGRDNSGVVREDYFDWRKTAREMAASAERIDYVVIMMGANDRQPMRRPDGGVLDTFSDPWREAYGARVAEIVAAFRAKNVPVAWVGLPIMRSERYGADMKALNAIARVAAETAGAAYIDTWDRFADETGAFEADGPDVNGRVTRLRTSDGIYFTRAGGLKLAHFVEGDIARLAGAPPVAAPAPGLAPSQPLMVAPDAGFSPPALDAAEIDVAAVIRREAGGAQGRPGEGSGGARLSPELPGVPPPEPLPAPVFPSRPAAGPVTSLTQPPRAPDGKLAAAPSPRPAVTDPRPGRADDFAWPRR